MGKVLCFGEMLLRLSPDTDGTWLNKNLVPVFVGGSELNVASALTLWNIPAKYCTSLPDNFLSTQLIHALQQKNIDTSSIHLGGERVGLYYVPAKADVKSPVVIYDRKNSSFANLEIGMVNWDLVFKDVSWFHFSAICPALSSSVAAVCEEALIAADKKGITVSVDLNYREKLWQNGENPRSIMPRLVQYCDIVMGNLWAAELMLSLTMDKQLTRKDDKKYYLEQALRTSENLEHQFPKCKVMANTFRIEKRELHYYTTLYYRKKLFLSTEYKGKPIDKVGSGDCFMAGLIYGFLKKLPAQEMLDFATAAAFQKLFIKGDTTNKTVKETKAFAKTYE